jgi:hypothetical protein
MCRCARVGAYIVPRFLQKGELGHARGRTSPANEESTNSSNSPKIRQKKLADRCPAMSDRKARYREKVKPGQHTKQEFRSWNSRSIKRKVEILRLPDVYIVPMGCYEEGSSQYGWGLRYRGLHPNLSSRRRFRADAQADAHSGNLAAAVSYIT